jgi:hypothetical protein
VWIVTRIAKNESSIFALSKMCVGLFGPGAPALRRHIPIIAQNLSLLALALGSSTVAMLVGPWPEKMKAGSPGGES